MVQPIDLERGNSSSRLGEGDEGGDEVEDNPDDSFGFGDNFGSAGGGSDDEDHEDNADTGPRLWSGGDDHDHEDDAHEDQDEDVVEYAPQDRVPNENGDTFMTNIPPLPVQPPHPLPPQQQQQQPIQYYLDQSIAAGTPPPPSPPPSPHYQQPPQHHREGRVAQPVATTPQETGAAQLTRVILPGTDVVVPTQAGAENIQAPGARMPNNPLPAQERHGPGIALTYPLNTRPARSRSGSTPRPDRTRICKVLHFCRRQIRRRRTIMAALTFLLIPGYVYGPDVCRARLATFEKRVTDRITVEIATEMAKSFTLHAERAQKSLDDDSQTVVQTWLGLIGVRDMEGI